MKRNSVVWALIFAMGMLAGTFLTLHFTNGQVRKVQAAGGWTARNYYLSKMQVAGDKPLQACASGYHMASLWEIFNVSTLQYNTTLGVTTGDSGSGPPSGEFGWIRSSLDIGPGNCNGWTTGNNAVQGPAVRLKGGVGWFPLSVQPQAVLAPWESNGAFVSCATLNKVWCVQN